MKQRSAGQRSADGLSDRADVQGSLQRAEELGSTLSLAKSLSSETRSMWKEEGVAMNGEMSVGVDGLAD